MQGMDVKSVANCLGHKNRDVTLKIYTAVTRREEGLWCLLPVLYIDTGTRRVQIYPDTLDSITSLIEKTMMSVSKVVEAEKAYIIVSKK